MEKILKIRKSNGKSRFRADKIFSSLKEMDVYAATCTIALSCCTFRVMLSNVASANRK